MKRNIKFILLVFSLLLSACIFFACTYSEEHSVSLNVNGENVIDAKVGVDTSNPNLVTTDINTSAFSRKDFGTQDGKAISWFIIEDDDNYQYLFSEKVLDCMPYDISKKRVEFVATTMFDYLNSDFIYEYFNVDEREQLLTVNDDQDFYVTIPTLDNLLDMYEKLNYINPNYYGNPNYFEANAEICAKPTEHAINNDIDPYDNATFAEIIQADSVDERYNFANGNVAYWVIDQTNEEDLAEDEILAFYITATGYISYSDVDQPYIGIRPIIRIKK